MHRVTARVITRQGALQNIKPVGVRLNRNDPVNPCLLHDASIPVVFLRHISSSTVGKFFFHLEKNKKKRKYAGLSILLSRSGHTCIVSWAAALLHFLYCGLHIAFTVSCSLEMGAVLSFFTTLSPTSSTLKPTALPQSPEEEISEIVPGTDSPPYWQVNVPEAQKELVKKCPEFLELRRIKERHRDMISVPSDQFHYLEWEEVKRLIGLCRILQHVRASTDIPRQR